MHRSGESKPMTSRLHFYTTVYCVKMGRSTGSLGQINRSFSSQRRSPMGSCASPWDYAKMLSGLRVLDVVTSWVDDVSFPATRPLQNNEGSAQNDYPNYIEEDYVPESHHSKYPGLRSTNSYSYHPMNVWHLISISKVPRDLLEDVLFVVLHVETTGLDDKSCHVIQLAAKVLRSDDENDLLWKRSNK